MGVRRFILCVLVLLSKVGALRAGQPISVIGRFQFPPSHKPWSRFLNNKFGSVEAAKSAFWKRDSLCFGEVGSLLCIFFLDE